MRIKNINVISCNCSLHYLRYNFFIYAIHNTATIDETIADIIIEYHIHSILLFCTKTKKIANGHEINNTLINVIIKTGIPRPKPCNILPHGIAIATKG